MPSWSNHPDFKPVLTGGTYGRGGKQESPSRMNLHDFISGQGELYFDEKWKHGEMLGTVQAGIENTAMDFEADSSMIPDFPA